VSLYISEPYNKLLLISTLQMFNFLSFPMSLLRRTPFRHAIHFLACHKWFYMSKFQTCIISCIISFSNPECDSSSPVSRILVVSPTRYKTVVEKHLFWIKITSVLRFPIIHSAVIQLTGITLKHAERREVKQQEINETSGQTIES
jgi:hypothetical protein